MVNPAQESQTNFRTSPRLIILGLMALSTILIVVGDVRFETSERLRVLNFALLIYAAGGAAWLLEDWRAWLGRWFTLAALVVILILGVRWLGIPEFLSLMPLSRRQRQRYGAGHLTPRCGTYFLFAITIVPNERQPMTVALYNIAGSFTVEWNVQMAAAFLTALPTLLIYILLGRYFLRGVLAGSMKG